MKISRFSILFSITILAGLLLSACSGSAGVATSWPGISADGDTGYLAYNTRVYALNLTNGTEKWRYPAKADNKITFFASPVLTPDGQLLAGSYNNQLHSLNPATGEENTTGWPFQAKGRFIASPLVTNQAIYAPNADNTLYALDFTGKTLWTFTTGHALWATPSTDGKNLYLSSMDHRVYAVNPSTGSQVWKTEDLGGAVVGTPTVGPDGTLYVGTFAGEMLALDSQTGVVKNRYKTTGWVWAGPALVDNRLYFGDLDGVFYALNAGDLSEVWKVQPDTAATRSISDRPLVIQDTIYFTSESGTLFALDIQNGNPRWSKPIGGKLYSAPVQDGERLLVTPVGAEALVVALDMNGNQVWPFTPAK